MKKKISLAKQGMEFYRWSQRNPIGIIPVGVAKEGAGENRIPFTHFANSLPTYLVFLDILRRSRKTKASVLDLGCGTGRNISYVREALKNDKWEFFGVDYSLACISYAKNQYKKQRVKFVQHDGAELPYPNGSFDYLVSSHVMEHIKEKDQPLYLKEIARVLRPGGIAVVGEPNRKYCQDLFCLNPKENIKYRLVLPHEHEHYARDLRALYRSEKGFSSYQIWQTINPICRKLFVESTRRIKPAKEGMQKIIFEIYSVARKSHFFQDIMARLGTELLIAKMKTSYEDLLKATKLLQYDKPDNGDNFIVISKK